MYDTGRVASELSGELERDSGIIVKMRFGGAPERYACMYF